MKHSKIGRKLGRKRNQKKALLRSLSLSLINNGKIETSEAKAKELRPYIEKVITRAKTNSVFSRRILRAKLGADSVKLFEEIAPKYKDRNGGYTRIIKLGHRKSDGSPRAIIEFVS